MTAKAIGVALLCLTACALSQGARVGPAIDPMSAVEAKDVTAPIEGCGEQMSVGFLVCRKVEGDASNDSLTFVAPPVMCYGEAPCVTFKVFSTDGTPVIGEAFLKGTTRKGIAWKDLLKRNTFELGDRGFWGYSMTVRYIGPDQIERTTYAQGEIYLRVIKKGYIPLQNVKEDPHFFWRWKENGIPIKTTTGMRTFVGKKEND